MRRVRSAERSGGLACSFRMSVGEFADRVGIIPANVPVLKNGRAKAVCFATLGGMGEVPARQPGDLLEWVPAEEAS